MSSAIILFVDSISSHVARISMQSCREALHSPAQPGSSHLASHFSKLLFFLDQLMRVLLVEGQCRLVEPTFACCEDVDFISVAYSLHHRFPLLRIGDADTVKREQLVVGSESGSFSRRVTHNTRDLHAR